MTSADIDPKLTVFFDDLRAQTNELPKPVSGLDMFARKGTWTTSTMATMVDQFECWELSEEHIADLRNNLPEAKVRNVDSIKNAQNTRDRFAFISIDAPQCIYGDDYCEHFQALPAGVGLVDQQAVLTWPVNIFPYLSKAKKAKDDYGPISHEEWFKVREEFYGRPAEKLDIDFVEQFYGDFLEKQPGVKVDYLKAHLLTSEVEGHPDHFARMVARIHR